MNLIFYPKYSDKGPSSRYRIYQFLPMYKKNGFKTFVYPLFGDYYFTTKNKYVKSFLVLFYFFRRLVRLLKIHKNAIVWVEYEFFPFMPPIFEHILKNFGIYFVVEYDDAVFHRYDNNKFRIVRGILSKKISNVMSLANIVVTGSPYLTSYALNFNPKVIEIPTSLSEEKYQFNQIEPKDDKFIIGWIGSHTTSINILKLKQVFKSLSSIMNYKLHLVGFDKHLQSELDRLPVNFIEWSEQTEIEEIRKFDVGIMPLEDNPFNNGKCGFKLIQYMACSKPTISTPLEANVKINRNLKNLHAISDIDWIDAFVLVYNNRNHFRQIGYENHEIFKTYYSSESNYFEYAKILER
jgi:glycosyltransferase involved in cell wall biosynthesis